jgi:hypothetical protein
MIAIGKGAKVFLPGEWNGSVRSAAVCATAMSSRA